MGNTTKFPSMHIAQSVLNRILNFRNTLDDEALAQVPSLSASPDIADPLEEGTGLNQALQQPPGAALEGTPGPGDVQAAGESLATGQPLVQTLARQAPAIPGAQGAI